LTSVQRVYGKGRYDGIVIGIMIAAVAFITFKYFNTKGEHQHV